MGSPGTLPARLAEAQAAGNGGPRKGSSSRARLARGSSSALGFCAADREAFPVSRLFVTSGVLGLRCRRAFLLRNLCSSRTLICSQPRCSGATVWSKQLVRGAQSLRSELTNQMTSSHNQQQETASLQARTRSRKQERQTNKEVQLAWLQSRLVTRSASMSATWEHKFSALPQIVEKWKLVSLDKSRKLQGEIAAQHTQSMRCRLITA
jgi:hypothetical protein